MAPPGYPGYGYAPGLAKPGQVTAIAIMCLISGILDCLGATTMFCLWPGGIYSLIVGIFEIMYATRILPDPIRTSRMGKALAIMQIINIINFSILSVVTGILSLVFYNDPQVQGYYYEMQRRGVPG